MYVRFLYILLYFISKYTMIMFIFAANFLSGEFEPMLQYLVHLHKNLDLFDLFIWDCFGFRIGSGWDWDWD